MDQLAAGHKSSSWLYGGAKRLLGQTAAAINLNSHVETRRLVFHAGVRYDPLAVSPFRATNAVSRSEAAKYTRRKIRRKERESSSDLSLSLFFSRVRPHLRTLLRGNTDENALFPLPTRLIGSNRFSALDQLITIWIIILPASVIYVWGLRFALNLILTRCAINPRQYLNIKYQFSTSFGSFILTVLITKSRARFLLWLCALGRDFILKYISCTFHFTEMHLCKYSLQIICREIFVLNVYLLEICKPFYFCSGEWKQRTISTLST